MKLNPDCVRDVMLYVEEHLSLDSPVCFVWDYSGNAVFDPKNSFLVKKYSAENIDTSFGYVVSKGYLKNNGLDGTYMIREILPDGFDFLECVRISSVFDEAKKAVTDGDMQKITEVAKMLVKNYVNKVAEEKIGTKPFQS